MDHKLDINEDNNNNGEMLSLIFKYFEKVSLERNVDSVLLILADMGRDLVNAERCALWLLDKETRTIYTKVAHGVDKLVVAEGEGIVGSSISSGEELIINNPYSDPRFSKSVDKETGFITREIIVIPIRDSKGEIMGAFQALNKTTGNRLFTKEDLSHLRLAASYSGKSIENVVLNNEIEETQNEVISLLGLASEMRSLETRNHVKRVARYSGILGKAVGLSDKDVNQLMISSPMHDIGKIGIPDSILMKPGRLTDAEYNIMKTHAIIGYNILNTSKRSLLKSAGIIAYEHHEKFDGSGYPRGLVGEDIHIFGRITAICDVFDALICERVYKKAWDKEEIFSLLKREKGKHFDPQLIDLFFKSLPEIMYTHELYKDDPDF